MNLISASNGLAPDRITVAGVLAVRCLRYVNEAAPVPTATLPKLQLRSTRAAEQPLFHRSTGLYGFLGLSPDDHRIHINDPTQRYLPRAIQVTVPDRSNVVAVLQRGGRPPVDTVGPLYVDAAMRPSVSYPLAPGESAIWGRVIANDGQPVAYCRLQLATRHDDSDTTVISYSDSNGVYLLRLPGEKVRFVLPKDIDDDDVIDIPGELTTDFDRRLSVHSLRQNPLSLAEPLDAFPADFDTLNPDDANSPYRSESFRLHNPATDEQRLPDGTEMPQPMIQVGRRIRWDIFLI